MSSINGIDFNSISSCNGVSWNSVTNIGGVPVSSGGGCTSVLLGYVNFGTVASEACYSESQPYDFNANTLELFLDGACGQVYAPDGFYSDGITIYAWENGIYEEYGLCKK
jgi:hypothetical protein